MVRISEPDDRGQLLLVGAVGIALVVVGTVVLINGLAFDESIGARSSDDALGGAERTVEMVETDLNTLAMEVRTDIDPSSRDFVSAFRENISLYSRHYTNLSFDNGIVYTKVVFDGADSVNGSTIRQTEDTTQGACDNGDQYPRFTLEDGSDCQESPTIVQDANEVSQFNLTVEDTGSGSAPQTDLVVENGAGVSWRLVMNAESNGSVVIDEQAPSGTSRVGVFDPTFELVLQEDGRLSVDGTADVTFADGITGPYDIGFENSVPGGGTALTGTYSISTDGDPPSTIGTQPETFATVVRPAVDIYYQRRDVTYNRTVVLNETGVR